MTRKKKDNKPKKLDAGQYWEWVCTMEQLKASKLNEKRIHLEREIMNKQIENAKLKLALFKETVQAARRSVEKAELESEKFIQRLQEELGIDLKECVIDENTFEVRNLNDPIIDEE